MKLFATLLIFVLALCSCAQMTVNVSILDQKFWSSPEQLSNSISMQVAEVAIMRENGRFARVRESMKAEWLKEFDPYFKKLVAEGKVDPNDRSKLVNSLAKSVDTSFKEADLDFNKAFKELGKASAVLPPGERLGILFQAQSHLESGYGRIFHAEARAATDLNAELKGANELELDKAAEVVKSKIETQLEGLIGEHGILEDPLASAVVFAPESYWQRPDSPSGINETYATGMFGNTDIAIKMEAVGSFTIKGVRLDASKITQATFAVGRQAIKTVAALYGVPMPTTEVKTTQPTPATPFAETAIGFQSPDRRRAAAEEELLRRRLARLMLMETILIQRKALTDPAVTAEARATAVDTVKKLFTANRAQLDSPPASNQ
jgi:hypothetical protein